MYVFLLVLFLGLGGACVYLGLRRHQRLRIVIGSAICALTISFFGMMSFWGEMLWFEALGLSRRFWVEVGTRAALAAAGAVVVVLAVRATTRSIKASGRLTRIWPECLAVVLGLRWGLDTWDEFLKYWNQSPTGLKDPILQRDLSFYLFTLPLADRLFLLLVLASLLGAVAATLATAARSLSRERSEALTREEKREIVEGIATSRPLATGLGLLALALAYGAFLQSFHLLYSRHGVVTGPGWTDVHLRLPAWYLLSGLLTLAGIALIFAPALPSVRHRLGRRLALQWGPLGVAFAAWFVAIIIVPSLAQWIYVQPNEVSVERPYIRHNIRMTRDAFGLEDIVEREYPVSGRFNREIAEDHAAVLSQVRIWDPRALDAVYKQFQEIRLYYEFDDVDIDRYTVDGQYRQVMISPREMALDNLPRQSQTFVNRRFKYTHGYGLTMAPVNEFTQGGLPRLLVRDIPPKARFETLEVHRPEIYFGELTDTPVIVNSEEEEFDHPKGAHNVYLRYDGEGGVLMKNLWRKILYGWKFDGTRLLLSTYPNPESRIMFHRQIRDRIRTIAPFLDLDADPYCVLHDGRLLWIMDAYTTSSYYPYSEPFRSRESTRYQDDGRTETVSGVAAGYLQGVNYIRNSVKAVVDAYDGSVELYVFEPEDPLIRVWRAIFPGLFREARDMPPGIRAHIRYPEGYLLAQGLTYAVYHMTDPDVFYNQEDVWVRATEKYYAAVQQVEPYYVMWQPPEAQSSEFILMFPFTPKDRQVLIGWMAGMCDGENYGRLVAYRFPKEKRVVGTQQVETKIDQDPHLSQQLTLWDQRGSRVVRGNVLAIPVGETILYVEPIYLQAEAAAYPELRLVVVMHGDQLSYASSLDEALANLLDEEASSSGPDEGAPVSRRDQLRRARRAFRAYLDGMGAGEFEASRSALERLSEVLEATDPGDDEDRQGR